MKNKITLKNKFKNIYFKTIIKITQFIKALLCATNK